MAKKQFDKSQKMAINADKNSVVSAGAGSGKTTVLSERYCRLVIEKNYKPEEILTLTFTKKATTEMSSRIYKVLKEKAPDAAREFYKANIKTLDSYCASIAKMGCRFYGISPEFVQDKDTLDQKAASLALEHLMKNRSNPVIRQLVGTSDFVTAAQEIFSDPVSQASPISEPIDFDASLKLQREEIVRVWNKAASDFFSVATSFKQEVDNNFSGNTTKTVQSYRDAFENGIPEAPELTEEMIISGQKEEIEEFLESSRGILNVKKPGKIANSELLSEYVDSFREDIQPYFEAVSAYLSTYGKLEALIPLLKDYQEELNNFKRSSGFLSFKDISSLALSILRDYPEIRKIEKQKYKAIMIDEFQDNNQLQRDMLFLLSEKEDRMEKSVPPVEELNPDKLFFVGDEKQSIYLFRGADVSVFRALSSDFKDGNLRMDTNYRSHIALIASFNSIFGGEVYPPYKSAASEEKVAGQNFSSGQKKSDVQNSTSEYNTSSGQTNPSAFYVEGSDCEAYEAVYKHVEIPEDMQKKLEEAEKPEEFYAPHLHFAFYDKEDQISSSEYLTEDETEADWIAKKIKTLVTQGVNGKVFKYSDIAILLRNYSTQNDFERMFLNHGIPYNTETVKGFFNDGPVNDIFSYLRLLVYPEDRLSYAQLLSSPFVNLSEEETEGILLLGEEPFCLSDKSLLGKESLFRFEKAGSFYFELKEKIKSMELPEIITELWYKGSYRYEVLWNQSVVMYEKMYDLIFALALKAKNNGESLADFVDNARAYMDERSKFEDMDIPMEKVQGVNILSIHKSKGLEYPVVFVASAHKGSARDSNSGPVYYDKKYGLSVNLSSSSNYFYNKTKELRLNKAAAELRRVVYVALTRAIDELYVTCGKFDSASIANASDYEPGGNKRVESVFQVLLPFYAHYSSENYSGLKPFDEEKIQPVKRIFSQDGQKRKNTFEEKKNLFEFMQKEGFYEKAQLVERESLSPKYVTPSSLHDSDPLLKEEENLSGQKASPSSAAPSVKPVCNSSLINEIIERADGNFDYSTFGSLAHSYMEAAVKGEDFYFPEKYASSLKEQKDKNILLNELSSIKDAFFAGTAGKDVLEARKGDFCKTEFPFKSYISGKIVNGVMDLVFKNKDGTYTILDYKTDQSMDPSIYCNQLACYRKSLCEMLDIKEASSVKCLIHFLRYGKTMDITRDCDSVDFESILL